jgi:hypothetical protein
VARLAAMVSQMMESRADAAQPNPSMPLPPRPAGVEQPAYRAMAESFHQHEKLEGYLRGAGFVDSETAPPEFLGLVRASRESTLPCRLDGVGVVTGSCASSAVFGFM